MNGFGVDNKFSGGRSIQTISSINKEAKAETSMDKEKREELMSKYQSRKAVEAETLAKQLKNDHSVSARNLTQFQRAANSTDNRDTAYDQAKKLLLEANQKHCKPVLGKGLRPGDVFDLNRKICGTQLAKQRAIEMMKNRRIEKQDPNKAYLSTNKKSQFELSNILNRVESNLVEGEEVLNSGDGLQKESTFLNCEVLERRKRKAQEEVQAKRRKMEAIEAIMSRKSSHEHEIRDKEIEAENKYFDLMEKKERIEDHMANTFQTDCSVVICKVCNYTDHKQSDFCRDKKHMVISKNVVKRFFRCRECKTRTHTFAQVYPVKRCKCGSDQFEKAAMYNVKEGPKLDSEKLLVRGEELKFLNSLQ